MGQMSYLKFIVFSAMLYSAGVSAAGKWTPLACASTYVRFAKDANAVARPGVDLLRDYFRQHARSIDSTPHENGHSWSREYERGTEVTVSGRLTADCELCALGDAFRIYQNGSRPQLTINLPLFALSRIERSSPRIRDVPVSTNEVLLSSRIPPERRTDEDFVMERLMELGGDFVGESLINRTTLYEFYFDGKYSFSLNRTTHDPASGKVVRAQFWGDMEAFRTRHTP